MNKRLLMLLFFSFLCSCEWSERLICGEPTGDLKIFIESVNNNHSATLSLKQVPCYPGYAQRDLKEYSSSEFIDSLVQEIRRHSFVEVLVYDKEKKLIIGDTGSM